MRRAVLSVLLLLSLAAVLISREPASDARMRQALRRPLHNGWIFVHLEGAPAMVGFQHGFLLAPEIQDAQKVIAALLERDTGQGWSFFRAAAQNVLWPHVGREYRQELQGIAEGLNARGVKLDVWDVTAMNGWIELSPYWFEWQRRQKGEALSTGPSAPEHCSAFVATGSYTRDGKPVIGHNSWTGYMDGARWNIIFDIVPRDGHRFLMDGFPGLIHSGDDFGINSAGILITETTISRFSGFDPNGIPEFERARRAMQYSSSIDDFARIMKDGNNGGYANGWLVADRNTGEIASLELGLKHVTLRRTRDGYYAGSNFPVDPDLAREETHFDVSDLSNSANARHVRWDQLMAEHKGKIDVALGQKFLGDHYDTFDKKEQPGERTLCGHVDLSPRGSRPWVGPYAPAGAVQAKATDAAMAAKMEFTAAMGHSCGLHFLAGPHLAAHPEYLWQKPYLRDLRAHPWTEFRAER
jgi:hypothetical protein